MTSNAFAPSETRRILRRLRKPAVFTDMTCDWPVLRWTAEHLAERCGDKPVRFRLGKKEGVKGPLFETQCSYIEAKLTHFLRWTQNQSGTDVGPFVEYPYSDYWAYADYKYIARLFHDQPFMFEDVKWSDFGFEGRDGKESTLWIGTEGANTPCHMDSYGCNLVLQVQGRKRWHLFPPEDTANLYPTRIPYEESSVFSRVDVLRPELGRFPAFRRARPHVVTLQPGQVLYVPRHWWHYVQSVDPITVSVNSWIELEDDDVARVSEAVTKAVVCAIKSAQSDDDTDDWLNPTEEGVTSHNENIQYLNLAVGACAQRRSSLCHVRQRKARPVKRGATGSLRNDGDQVDRSTFSVPFGPSLIPVCQREDWPEPGSAAAEEPVKPRGTAEDRVLISGSAPGTDPPPAERSAGSAPGRDRRHAVTTDDLLDCLLHPDVMSRVTELLLERHAGSPRSTSPP
ncbi:HSPB1-associated protein 1 homolog isoform X1 [Betta splendens]|uniref:HSPB1-associated protein 1 homolog isoform X1 n=1 Tax=Betta splendens TaxID=158456 RepID=A0A6P7LB97_BETSP|nr:HSPB1-associated protein 1 homolog isoform X1 [Betta splendens]XP_028991593.1 HSPB1-associated protein 1 homolog isoform X1 [Betta splendens]XP_028991594.1 HSPB1-associated protein 1 homolog isoform X1 [Betta splendens]